MTRFIAAGVALLLLLGQPMAALSQIQQTAELSELKWVDEGYLQRQRETIDEISRMEFGVRLRKNLTDLRTLDRIVENDLIKQPDIKTQQALGVALGDVFVAELGLEWKVYEDGQGKSRATCLPKTEYCLFPVTMLSKRMKLGVKPDVTGMYEKGKALLQPHLPRTPYSADK